MIFISNAVQAFIREQEYAVRRIRSHVGEEDYKLFLATDSAAIVEGFRASKEFGDRVVVRDRFRAPPGLSVYNI